MSNSYEVFSVKNESVIYPPYLFVVLINEQFGLNARKVMFGLGRTTASFKDLVTVPVTIPDMSIQRKIGDKFFKSTDD